ncbi:MAG: Uncharacterised protein [Opitutia bacterium UBA7350]|nr:MAG: Uncharacterised protein [Opitutae bacterium UBA7350]
MKKILNRGASGRRAGFSLLELIGVMAVTSILLAAAIPLTVNVIENRRLVDEKAALPPLADALKRGILREQMFPIYNNSVSRAAEGGNEDYWWNIAGRHGSGSAIEARYPLGSRNNEGNVRKLYFADSSFSGLSFADLTDDGREWLIDFKDPLEMRLLLLSTTNPDLPIPDTLSSTQFNNIWDDWAVGSDGAPLTGSWNLYGLSETAWENRAAELVVQRVDLREWLCEVRIENFRSVKAPNGTIFDENKNNYPNSGAGAYASRNGTDLIDEWDNNTAFVSTSNMIDAEASIIFTEQSMSNGNGNNNGNNATTTTVLTALVLSDRGKIQDDGEEISITVAGYKNGVFESTEITLLATDRAPMALIDPDSPNSPIDLGGWGNSELSSQTRYFLLGQQLLLGEPWSSAEVGTFEINENLESLRFDGERWSY